MLFTYDIFDSCFDFLLLQRQRKFTVQPTAKHHSVLYLSVKLSFIVTEVQQEV